MVHKAGIKNHIMAGAEAQYGENKLFPGTGRDDRHRHTGGGHYPPSSMPCGTVNQRPARSARRRPRSRKDNRACFEHVCNEGGAEAASQLLLLPELGLPNLIHQSGRGADLFGVAPLTDSQHNNYLDFLLHPDQGPSLQTSQVFSPELPTFLPTSHQWEKLPMLYSEDPGMQECDNKDTNSCSPDSVITNFSGDVFDSLEPLCPAPSEWWVIH